VTDENGKKVINKEHTGLDVQLPGRSAVANMCRSGNEWPLLLIIQDQVKFDVGTDLNVRTNAHWPCDAVKSGINSIFLKNMLPPSLGTEQS
jgi:hypothetical protein